MARQALFHQIANGKWKYRCKCGNTAHNDWFNTKKEAELAFDIHWIGCNENPKNKRR